MAEKEITPVKEVEPPAKVAVVPYWSYWVVPLGLALIGMVQVWGITYLQRVEKAVVQTAESTEKIHVSTNSERTATLKTIKELRDEILQLSIGKAKSDQKALDVKK